MARKRVLTAKDNPGRSNTTRQDRFVDEYIIDGNATEAAKRAGFSARSAGQIGHRLMKNVEIQTKIAFRKAEISAKCDITAERILQEYAALAFLDPSDLFARDGTLKPIDDIPDHARRAIAGLELMQLRTTENGDVRVEAMLKKVKMGDKKGALDSLSKILGLMRDKVEVDIGENLADAIRKGRERLRG